MGVITCKVKGCKSSSKSKITLFGLPVNGESAEKWSEILGVKLRKNSRVCEKHFHESSIKRGYYKEKTRPRILTKDRP